MRIVVLGGSFGGLTVAYELKRLLRGNDHEIVVISKDRKFVFIPSLPWVALGQKKLEEISFDLERPLARRGIKFLEAAVERIDPDAGVVHTTVNDQSYDYLVIATGHRSANEAVPGLGPFTGPGHSLMSPPEAEELREAWVRFLENPGPVVVGCAPGASCIGPAYEFAFEIAHDLKRRKVRHKVPITFVTPEPFLGHFGVGGFGKAQQFLERAFEERGIRYHTSIAVTRITETSVELADGRILESRLSMIIPPLAGVKAIAGSSGIGNPKGFVPVDEHYRHRAFPNIYAVGVAIALPPADQTPVPVNFPKTGHMTEQMARIAARNIAAEVTGGAKVQREISVQCIMDMGDRAVHMAAEPVRPPRTSLTMSEGRRWLWAKRMYAAYYLWKMKHGKVGALDWAW